MSTHARACALQLLRDLDVPVPNGGRSGRPRMFTLAQEVAILARLKLGERQIAIAAGAGRQPGHHWAVASAGRS